MAKKIYDSNDQVIGFEPGVIYALVYADTPFYVGETTDPERRLGEHRTNGRNPQPDAETKYQFIKHLNDAGIEWSMEILTEYGSEGPEALEDELMMAFLVEGYTLTNEKKGNANWMAERVAVADDMRARGIHSFKEYQEIIKAENVEGGIDRRTPGQREQLVKLMTVIKGSADEALAWSLKHEKKMARLRKNAAEREKDQFVDRLTGIAEETVRLTTAFPLEEQISIMQGLVLTYQKEGANEALLQTAMKRLTELQELTK